MTLTIDPVLESKIRLVAEEQHTLPEEIALEALREKFRAPVPLPAHTPLPPDELMKLLQSVAVNTGFAPPRDAFGRDEMYD